MNELELISACQRNDRKAQKKLFELHKDTLYLISLKYCKNQKEAEDNLHDSFITIFQTIKKFNGTGSFEGWMKRITIYKAIDKFKRNIKDTGELETHLEVTTYMEASYPNVSLNEVLSLIQELPDQYRMVFSLYQLDEYSHKEVAEILGISESTSKSNFYRAKILLRKRLMQISTPKLK